MKLISLNIWAGAVYEPLINFFEKYSNDTDIFCLQEVWSNSNPPDSIFKAVPENVRPKIRTNILSEIKDVLPEFNNYFAPAQDDYGVAIFSKKDIPIKNYGEFFVYRTKDSVVGSDATTLGRNLQYIEFENNNKTYTVSHFHGLWAGGGKKDTDSRIEQSKKVSEFLDKASGAKVLCGDFNLLPDTESLRILEKNMRNLLKEYGITSTRSHYYTKPEKFADYILVSPDVNVNDFKVLPDVVSDHMALMLDFS